VARLSGVVGACNDIVDRAQALGSIEMPIIIEDGGTNSTILISPQMVEEGSGRISISGDANRIEILPSRFPLGVYIQMMDGASLSIGANLNARDLFIHARRGAVMTIGHTVGCNGQLRLLMHEAGHMSIGDGCLFADATDVTNSDMHSIIDVASGERINPARDVSIGEKVWIGQRCMILKGSKIGQGSIIGAGSVVSAAVPELSLAVGCPARVLRSGVTWDFRLL
jgi:acetyltransferase-like isoleucine patch superfamily enzyme